MYNRRSDLNTLRPIDHASVTCGACGAVFAIGGDLINSAHEMILLDCRPFFDRKQFMQVVLGIAQAYENLGLYLDAREVYRQIEARDSAFAEARLRDAAIVELLRAPAR